MEHPDIGGDFGSRLAAPPHEKRFDSSRTTDTEPVAAVKDPAVVVQADRLAQAHRLLEPVHLSCSAERLDCGQREADYR